MTVLSFRKKRSERNPWLHEHSVRPESTGLLGH